MPGLTDTFDSPTHRPRWLMDYWLIGIYLFINCLFVWKYFSPYLIHPWVGPLLYSVAALAFVFFTSKSCQIQPVVKSGNLIHVVATALVAIMLAVVMYQFDPDKIAVGRYPALQAWLSRFLSGEFPYASEVRPSGFPFLFILALPFYLLGELGLLQIVSFAIFAGIVFVEHNRSLSDTWRRLLLLLGSPIFLYEIVVRSELFSNMVLIILFLTLLNHFCVKQDAPPGRFTPCLLGILGGLLLSTRGVVLLVYIIAFGYMLRHNGFKPVPFFISMMTVFFLTLLPFILWNGRYFFDYGPFAIQMSYLPPWLLSVGVISSLICACSVRSLKAAYAASAAVLFATVLAAFSISVFEHDLIASVIDDRFDISYFAFSLPFLLMAIRLPAETVRLKNYGG